MKLKELKGIIDYDDCKLRMNRLDFDLTIHGNIFNIYGDKEVKKIFTDSDRIGRYDTYYTVILIED